MVRFGDSTWMLVADDVSRFQHILRPFRVHRLLQRCNVALCFVIFRLRCSLLRERNEKLLCVAIWITIIKTRSLEITRFFN